MERSAKEDAARRRHIEADRKTTAAAYARLPAINGYAEVFSIFPGETLHIRAARKPSRNPLSRLWRARVKSVEIRSALTGEVVCTHIPAARTDLPSQKPVSYRDGGAGYACRIALDTGAWKPGLYECMVRDSAGRVSQDIFCNVKPRTFEGRGLVCVLPTFTWQAYNRLSGGSFYNAGLGPVRTISTQRPINRTGDNSVHGATPFLEAFAQENIGYACIDSSDLHHGLLPEGRITVMALLTHDEYWSVPMRAAVDAFLARGGVLLVLAGNVCWWKIDVEGDNLIVDKEQIRTNRKRATITGNQWYQLGLPEERTFVSSYRFGGYAVERMKNKQGRMSRMARIKQSQSGDSASIQVTAPDHPVFRGVALEEGNRFGGDVPIMYREIDAVPLKDDGSVDRMWYDADDVDPRVLATGAVVLGPLFHSAVSRVGVVVEAEVGGGHVLHMGSFGWSLGLSQKNAAVKQVVINAYRYCLGLAEAGSPRKPRKRRRGAAA